MSAVDLVLGRLENLRQIGRDRWRCACPVCGGKNRSTLSIGIGDTGAVLLRCWKEGCGPEQIAAAIGLQIEDLFPPRESTGRPLQRRRLISASQALELLEEEMTFAVIVMNDMHHGLVLDEATRERMLLATAHVIEIRDEVRA